MRDFSGRMFRVQAGLAMGLLASVFMAVSSVGAVDNQNGNNSESITLAPASQTYKLKTGDTKRNKLIVLNNSSKDISVIIYARPYDVSDELYTPDFTSQAANADFYKWVNLIKLIMTLRLVQQSSTLHYSSTTSRNTRWPLRSSFCRDSTKRKGRRSFY